MMTTSNENTSEFMFMPILSGLALIIVAAVLVWATQLRPATQAAGTAEQLVSGAVSASEAQAEAQPLLGDPTQGQQEFAMTCSACHGPAGEGIQGLGKDLTTSQFVADQADAALIGFIKVGRGPSDPLNTTGIDMPPKGGNPALSDEDLQNIVSYIRTIKK